MNNYYNCYKNQTGDNQYFNNALDDLKKILDSQFYADKGGLEDVRVQLKKWYSEFKENGTLTTIDVSLLKKIDLETKICDYGREEDSSRLWIR